MNKGLSIFYIFPPVINQKYFMWTLMGTEPHYSLKKKIGVISVFKEIGFHTLPQPPNFGYCYGMLLVGPLKESY